jgi:hypothetical protein
METKTIFLNENDTKEEIYDFINVAEKNISKYIKIITDKKYQNRIGYYQFFDKDTNKYYKFYVMPKTYKVKDYERYDCEECERKFIHFFSHYHRLVVKYDIPLGDDKERLGGNITDLSYRSKESAKALGSAMSLDDFIVHNYNDYLLTLETFFKKHNKKQFIKKSFYEQSLKGNIDIKKSIIDPNKSNIHQNKNIKERYSDIATISIVVLKYFINNKIKNFIKTEKVDTLKKDSYQLIRIIEKKNFSSDFSFKINELLLSRTEQKFKKNKDIYTALLKLVGKENYYKGNLHREIKKEENMIALFFRPEQLYEWIIYDELLESKEFDEVLKDGKDIKKEDYFMSLVDDEKEFNNSHESKPDLVAIKGSNKYIIDAKWKILPKKKSVYNIEQDILKLRRDAKIRQSNKGYLIYPQVEEDCSYQLKKEYKYSYDDFIFELRVIKVE